MSGDVIALVAGTLLAVGALAFVLYPLFFPVDLRGPRATAVPRPDAGDSAIVALREIEFDRATGKLSDADYAELKRDYGQRALQELRMSAPSGAVAGDPGPALDAIEARVRAMRATHRECPDCGVRPEPDAAYCSNCGGYLSGACPHCDTAIVEKGATFCSACGTGLSAVPAHV
jgi:hypothetical protein